MINAMLWRGRVMSYLWAAPVTAVGLVIAIATCRRGRLVLVDGVVEAHGPWLRWALRHLVPLPGGAAAITLGHVVLARDHASHALTRAHERVHVRQYERWGPLFVPAYLAAGLWAAVRGGHAYFDNPFEREAFDAE
jgi:hypothetical protein